MKKAIALFLVLFISSALLISCTDQDNNEEKNKIELPPIGTRVGYLFDDVTLDRVGGGSVSTEDYRGKVVILNIWATWCPPCKAELPDFDMIAANYKDDAVVIAAHSPYENYTAEGYVEENFPDASILFAYDTDMSDAYAAAGGNGYVPYTVILDQNGVIVYTDSGILSYEFLSQTIESLTK